jgi:hypothetical protein
VGIKRFTQPGGLANQTGSENFVTPGAGAPVTSVFARIGDVVAVLGDYTSSLVTNSSAVAGATVTAALNALAAAIAAIPSAPVASVFARAGAVVAAAGDYTSSLVTNASSVAGATVTDALNALVASAASSGTFPYIDRPSYTLAVSDEFTVDTFASGAWSLWNGTAAAAITTRVGDVTPYANTLTATQYRSTVIGSFLFFQFALNTDVYVYKARTAGAGNDAFHARFYRSNTPELATGGFFFGTWQNVAGHPGGNFSTMGWDNAAGTGVIEIYSNAGATTQTDTNLYDEVFMVNRGAPIGWHMSSGTGMRKYWGSVAGMSADYFGVRVITGPDQERSVNGVDFMRQYPTSGFPPY